MTKRHLVEEKGAEFGRAFEHFLLMEITAYRSYAGKDFAINFWRTKAGAEVDFILHTGSDIIPLEIKYSPFKEEKFSKSGFFCGLV